MVKVNHYTKIPNLSQAITLEHTKYKKINKQKKSKGGRKKKKKGNHIFFTVDKVSYIVHSYSMYHKFLIQTEYTAVSIPQ